MSRRTENPTRDLPISLQGIEKILQFLSDESKNTLSIRNISEYTGLSMRVVKNILFQLEDFNQVERVIEKNNVLPKWRITKFGKRVLKEAKGKESNGIFPSREDELIHNITVPSKIEDLRKECKIKQEIMVSELNVVQSDLSKTLGPIINYNNPIFEDLIGYMIKRVKFLKQRASNFPIDPLGSARLKKMDEKKIKVTKEEEKLSLTEIYFFYSVIVNELSRISKFISKLSQFLEGEAHSKGYSIAKDLRSELRILSSLINQREHLTIGKHKIPIEELTQILKGTINPSILDNLIEPNLAIEVRTNAVEEIVLKIVENINRGKFQLEDDVYDIRENIPLVSLYDIILDEKPSLSLTIEEFEQIIETLAENGYIPGLTTIQEDEDHYLKVVQLKVHDISEDESKLLTFSLTVEKFTLADILDKFSWKPEKGAEILEHLTTLGILKHSKSYLYGDQWYVVSESNS